MGISVLMSVYKKEKPEYLERALKSIYEQTLPPDEIVLVEDGELTDGLYEVIEQYKTAARIRLIIVKLNQNVQLGKALQTGLRQCSHDLIARMDSDDIAVSDRLEVQNEFMKRHPDITACGGDIAEFIEEGHIIRVKTMPVCSDALYEYGKLRNPLNHMTVMFRKKDIEAVGGYKHFPLLEDYHLWSRLLAAGYKIANVPKTLCEARIYEDFANKRGGWEYFKRYKKLRSMQLHLGYTNFLEYMIGLVAVAIMTMQPSVMRKKMYQRIRSNTCESTD